MEIHGAGKVILNRSIVIVVVIEVASKFIMRGHFSTKSISRVVNNFMSCINVRVSFLHHEFMLNASFLVGIDAARVVVRSMILGTIECSMMQQSSLGFSIAQISVSSGLMFHQSFSSLVGILELVMDRLVFGESVVHAEMGVVVSSKQRSLVHEVTELMVSLMSKGMVVAWL